MRHHPRAIARIAKAALAAVAVLLLVAHDSAVAQPAQADALAHGIALFEQQKWGEARAVLLPFAEQNRQDARAAFYLGSAFLNEGEVDRATTWLERAAKLQPNTAEYHLILASAYGAQAQRANFTRQAGLAGKAKNHLERAVALEPDNVRARFGLVQFYAQAPGIVGGSKQKARDQAAEIRRRDPYMAGLASAFILNAERNWAGAEREYRTLLQQHPDSARLYGLLAASLVQQSRHDEALDVYEGALRRRPGDLGATYQVGRLGAISGLRLPRAEQALRLYISQGPGPDGPPLAAAHWRLGMVLEKQGRTDDARREYENALRLDPKHADAKKSLDALRK